MNKFLQLDGTQLEDFEVALTRGLFAVRNVKLNSLSLNKYLDKTPFSLKSGNLSELTITFSSLLDYGGGEILIDGLKLNLTSTSEESLEFYDALEQVNIEEPLTDTLHQLADSLATDLLMDDFLEFREMDSNNLDSSGRKGVDMLEYAIGTIIRKFKLTLLNMTIILAGPQNYQSISISIPKFEIHQIKISDQITFDTPNGIICNLHLRNSIESILVFKESFCMVLDSLERAPSLIISGQEINVTLKPENLIILLEFGRLYKIGKRSTTRVNSAQQLDFNLKIFNITVNLHQEVNIVGEGLEINSSPIQGITIKIFKTSARSGSGSLIFEGGNLDIAQRIEGQPKVNFSAQSLHLRHFPTSSRETINTFLSIFKVSQLETKSQSITTFVNVEEIIVDNWELGTDIFKGKFTKVEFTMDNRQTALHCSFIELKIPGADLSFSRASIFKSIRGIQQREDSCIEWPFLNMITIIEGHSFTTTVSNPEEYFLLRSRIIEATIEHWHISIDNASGSGDLQKLGNLMKKLIPLIKSNDSPLSEGRRCVTTSVHHLEFSECELGIYTKVLGLEGLLDINNTNYIVDLRMDPIDLSIGNENKQVLVKKALTASLDPHFKPLIITINSTLCEKIVGVCLFGTILRIPLFSEKLDGAINRLKGIFINPDKVQNESSHSIFKVFLQLRLCSFCTLLPTRYQRLMAPHVLYMENFRAILGNTQDSIDDDTFGRFFLQGGEFFLAPGPNLVKNATGLFNEGHNYWEEQNYEALCKFDFIPIVLQKGKGGNGSATGGGWLMRIENNTLTVDLHRDSMQIFLFCINLYLKLLRDERSANLKNSSPKEIKVEIPNSDCLSPLLMDCFAGIDWEEEAIGSVFTIKEEKIDEIFKLEGDDDSGHLELDKGFYDSNRDVIDDDFEIEEDVYGMIELPLPEVSGSSFDATMTADQSGEVISRVLDKDGTIEFDEDFFTTNTTDEISLFPFTKSPLGGPLRMQIGGFSIRVRLHSGRRFHPNRMHHVANLKPSSMMVVSPEIPTTGQYECGSTFGGTLYPIIDSTRGKSQLSSSVASSSKWSNLMNKGGGGGGDGDKSRVPVHDYIELNLGGVDSELDWTNPFPEGLPNVPTLTSVRASIRTVEVIDHVRSSRWKSFLTRRTCKGDNSVRPMVQFRLSTFFVPVESRVGLNSSDPSKDGSSSNNILQQQPLLPEDQLESSIKLEVVPLRLHIDQDTLLFMMQFFEGPGLVLLPHLEEGGDEGSMVEEQSIPFFIQKFELCKVIVRLDYKPKRLDLRKALGGQYVQLLNFFELEDAEVQLPSVTLTGLNGGQDLIEQLIRAWMPIVRNTQMPQMLGGVAPIKTALNLSGGATDLVLLPIAQYKRDGRIVPGLKRGAASFLRAAALEGARLGQRLAVGAQVILEQADEIVTIDPQRAVERVERRRLGLASTSKYSAPPADAAEGLFSAYASLSSNVKAAAQTIVAVPVRVYERRGPGGAAKAVLRAMPIAVLQSAFGASEAMGRALIGVESSLDPSRGAEIKRKYKTQADRYHDDDAVGANKTNIEGPIGFGNNSGGGGSSGSFSASSNY